MTRRLRYRVDIYKRSDADGAETPSYSRHLAGVPVDIVQVSGGETYRGRQIEATATHVIQMRYLDGMLPTMKLVDTINSVTYYIVKMPKRDGRNHMFDLQVQEVVE